MCCIETCGKTSSSMETKNPSLSQIAHQMSSSTGHQSKVFQCCLCGYRAHHRSNVVRHVKKIHTIDLDESNLSTTTTTINNESTLIENLPLEHIHQSDDNIEPIPNYSLNTTVQAPLIIHQTNDPNSSYADIHLSINIFLPKKFRNNSVRSMDKPPFI